MNTKSAKGHSWRRQLLLAAGIVAGLTIMALMYAPILKRQGRPTTAPWGRNLRG